MIGWNIAPGLRRTFNSEGWPLIPDELWEQAREEAFDSRQGRYPAANHGLRYRSRRHRGRGQPLLRKPASSARSS